MGYKNAVKVQATAVENDNMVDLSIRNLHLFSHGAFSNVYKGDMNGEDGQEAVVIKKTWSHKDKKSLTEVSILKFLNRLRHKNIVRLLYTYRTHYAENTCYSLVFEFLPMNLYQYLKSHHRRIQLIETKMFTWQLFRGLNHLFRANICHRDIKPQNLLVNGDTGLLKISDFGSSSIDARATLQPSYHVTRYYRPPELLLGSKQYGPELDIWSGGCVLGEMLKGSILFLGTNTTHQFELIVDAFGVPSQEEMNNMNVSHGKWRDMKQVISNANAPGKGLNSLFHLNSSYCDSESLDILGKMLVYNPNKRVHGHELLVDPWFQDLFNPETRRPNGSRIGCLSQKDLHDVRIGDSSMTGTVSCQSAQQRVNNL